MNNLLPRFFQTEIRRKFIAVVFTLIIVIIGAFGAYWINHQTSKAAASLDARAKVTAQLLAETMATPMWNLDLELVQQIVDAAMADHEISEIEVYGSSGGDPLASAVREGGTVRPISHEADVTFTNGQGEQLLGKVSVVYTKELVAWSTRQDMMLILVVFVSLIVFLVSANYLLLSRLVVTPLKEMTRMVDHLAEGDCAVTIHTRSADEVGQMADAFRRMTAYLQNISEAANRIAGGDFTQEIHSQSERDVLGNAFQHMTLNLRDLIHKIFESADGLNSASDHLADAAKETGQATEQIATVMNHIAAGSVQQSEAVMRTSKSVDLMVKAIDGVARGAQDQAQAVSKTSTLTMRISQAIREVTTNAQMGAKDAASANQAAQEGSQAVASVVQGMAAIKDRVDASAKKVHEMGSRSDQIGAIVETIDDIASQTNLLALNAAIEAARAGEHGKGFAVVADEVRKLAEKSASATKEIGLLIKDIQKTVTEAVAAMEAGSSEVESGVARTNQAGASLKNILKAVEEVNHQVNAIAGAADSIQASSEELVNAMESVSAVVEENTAMTGDMAANSKILSQAIESIASISEENNAAVEEVSASSEEMSAQVTEVSSSAQALAGMANTLRANVQQFKLAG